MQTDLELLGRYHREADFQAFRDLVIKHTGMVFATARRVTQDAALAEDVAQETFLQLAHDSHRITESVAAWLHRVAWRRACNAVRNEATRRRYELAAAEAQAPDQDATWEQMEPWIDEALAEMPVKLRGPIVEHFLEGRPQKEVAARLGVNQSTVSRALDAGIVELRSRLRAKGVTCGAGLGLVLTANAMQSAPPALVDTLSQIASSGVGVRTSIELFSATAPRTWLDWLRIVVTVPSLLALMAAIFVWFVPNRIHEPAGAPANPKGAPSAPVEPHPPVPAVQPPVFRGRAFCPMCALPFTKNRRPKEGIFIHAENGVETIYDLQLPQPFPDFHRRFCVPSLSDQQAISSSARVEQREGREWLLPDHLEVQPK